ncbi:MAG: SCO family protein [Gammaproteobacteria bacterium]|jgi:protein SCO1/2
MTRKRLALIAFVVFDLSLLALVVGLFVARAQLTGDESFSEPGVASFEEPFVLQDFRLTDQHGQIFTRENLLGRWQFVFFGFTSCPDVCPFAMQALESFYREVVETGLGDETGVIMVSVDPLRDTPDVMADFVESFHPDFIGLTGEYPQIAGLAGQLFIAFAGPQEHGGSHGGDGDYQVPHSDYIAVIDPAGNYRGLIHAPHNRQRLIQAYQAFRAQ